MTLPKPSNLQCLSCNNKQFVVTQTLGPPRGFYDFVWRGMQCKRCGERLFWGAPLPADVETNEPKRVPLAILYKPVTGEHRVMKPVPIANGGKTANIDFSVTIPTTLQALTSQVTKARNKKKVELYCAALNKTLEELTVEEKKQLVRTLEQIT